jgi:hypothetical protein
MLDRRDLETVIASMDLANALLAQAEEAIDTASDAARAGRWYSAYANLWDGVRKALSALLQAQGLRPTRHPVTSRWNRPPLPGSPDPWASSFVPCHE